jgi:hypothetical protein
VLIGLDAFRVYKFTPFLLLNEQINNNKQRKEKEAKRKENQQHTESLFTNPVNKWYKYKGVYNTLLVAGLQMLVHLVALW